MARAKTTYVIAVPVQDGWELPKTNGLKGTFDKPADAKAALCEFGEENAEYDVLSIHATGLRVKPRETKRTKMVLVQ